MTKGARILIVDDEATFRNVMKNELTRMGFEVEEADGGASALAKLEARSFDVLLLDIQMADTNGIELLENIRNLYPELPVIMLTGQGTIESAVETLKMGAFHYVTKPCRLAELKAIIEHAIEKVELVADKKSLDLIVNRRTAATTLVGSSEAIASINAMIGDVAKSDSPVLILGESGTGKELAANAIHLKSPRARRPFIPVNCSSFSEGILESELFGHERGAFTGAVAAKQGLFEAAHGGTIFLDEIAEMTSAAQAKLLRVIESGETRRVGSVSPTRVDTRIVAATNRDIEKAGKADPFRRDLFYRLNVITVKIPPLRDRKEDIPVLIAHFLKKSNVAGAVPKTFTADAQKLLMGYQWPGNVRELQNIVERLLILSKMETIDADELTRLFPSLLLDKHAPIYDEETPLADVEREHILRVLAFARGDKEAAARRLGISLKTLYNKLKEYNKESESDGRERSDE